MSDLLKDKVAIITGSGRGIGKRTAELFIENGAKVAINDIDPEVCKATAEEFGENAIACVADVTNFEQVEKMANDTMEKWGRIDILVNCAGLTRDAMIHKMSDSNLKLIMDVNLKGTYVCSKTIIPKMIENKEDKEFKKVVNFASTTGVSGNIGQANYAIAKGGVIGFSKALAREYSLDRVNVNVVAPGFTETRMTQVKKPGMKMGIPKPIRDVAIGAIPFAREDEEGIRRGGLPINVANVVMFFSCYLGDWITGQLLTADGGQFI